MRQTASTPAVLLVLILLLPAASSVRADEPAAGGTVLDPVVVTASSEDSPASQIPGSTAVVLEEEIIARDPVSIPNLLENIPGLSKTSDSPWGSDVSIRGLSREAVIMLIDGCRVNTSTDLNGRFGLIDPEEVERIEVLKGPISSIYGSGSTGGVVNIITRRGTFSETEELHSSVSSSAASNPQGARGYGYANYNSPRSYAYASQSYREYSSYDDGYGREMPNSQFTDYETTVKGGFRLTEQQISEAQFQYYEGQDVGLPGTGTAPIPAAADLTYPAIRRGLVNFKHTYQPGGDLLKESSLNLYYQYIDRRSRLDNFPEAAPLEEINPAADHDTLGATWNNKVTMAGHTVLTGLDVWQRELSSSRIRFLRNGQMLNDTPLPDASFLSTGAFLVDSYKATDRLTLSGGGRVDALHVENDPTEVFSAEEDDDLAWNAHAGASLKLTDTITATAVAARGYRAASLEERYVFLDLGDGRVKLGNPNLDPERSTFFETGIHYVSSGLALSVSGFFNSLDDLIADQIVDEETIINANINQAEIYGTETDVRVLLADLWQLYSSFSYARGRDTLNNEDLPGIAPFNGLAGLRYDEGDGFWGYSELKFSAEQNNPPPGVDSSAEWIRVNMRLGYDFSAWQTEQTVYAGIDNIFDKGYSDYLTTSRGFVFNEPGRSFLVGYRTRF